ncbi:MarC family protein [Thermoactinospora rubra]|uniref:MarC family protein n=1 Tax=Thermoactinospora rubra TaxID=1088767 RepID=UPI00197D5CFA|nr:MarC family protein [Thermoactinospora rubra]
MPLLGMAMGAAAGAAAGAAKPARARADRQRRRLRPGALWVGEPLLRLLGISTAALTTTGGIALAYASIPLMRGKADAVEELEKLQEQERHGVAPPADPPPDLKSILFTPLSFPLTVGGTTFAFGVAASAEANTVGEKLALSVAALCFAAVTGLMLYLSGHVQRRISLKGTMVLDRARESC